MVSLEVRIFLFSILGRELVLLIFVESTAESALLRAVLGTT